MTKKNPAYDLALQWKQDRWPDGPIRFTENDKQVMELAQWTDNAGIQPLADVATGDEGFNPIRDLQTTFKGVSQRELAALSGVSRPTMFEGCHWRSMSPDNVLAIAGAFSLLLGATEFVDHPELGDDGYFSPSADDYLIAEAAYFGPLIEYATCPVCDDGTPRVAPPTTLCISGFLQNTLMMVKTLTGSLLTEYAKRGSLDLVANQPRLAQDVRAISTALVASRELAAAVGVETSTTEGHEDQPKSPAAPATAEETTDFRRLQIAAMLPDMHPDDVDSLYRDASALTLCRESQESGQPVNGKPWWAQRPRFHLREYMDYLTGQKWRDKDKTTGRRVAELCAEYDAESGPDGHPDSRRTLLRELVDTIHERWRSHLNENEPAEPEPEAELVDRPTV